MARAPRTPAARRAAGTAGGISRASRPAGASSAASGVVADMVAVVAGADIRRMFGGHGVFRDGLMFALHARDELYLKVDDAFAARLADLGSTPFHYVSSTREVTLPYWRLPEAALDDEELRQDLLLQALAVAHAAAARKAPKRKGGERKGGTLPQAPTAAGHAPPDFDALGLGAPAVGEALAAAKPVKAPKARPKPRQPTS